MKKIYSSELKSEIVKKYSCGITVTELSKEYNISKSTIYSWFKEREYKKQLNKKINLHDYNLLEQKCEQLEKMIEILKNAPCLVSSPLKERYDYIKTLTDKYSISLLCKTMNVAKGSYFNHILRNKNENTTYAKKRAEMSILIEEIFHNNNHLR